MSEKKFVDRLQHELSLRIPNYSVIQGGNILYKLLIDAEGRLQPINISKPRRGQLAFQTDLLIRNDKVPLVAIEVKFGHLSTHDVLTYSTKAMKHKEVYPYIRYGLIIGQKNVIPRRFFTHNTGFDFAMVTNREDKNDFKKLAEIIERQLRTAELLLEVSKGREVKRFAADISLE